MAYRIRLKMGTEVKKPKAYTKQDLETALEKITKGMTIKKASRIFLIPRGTLQNRIHNRTKKSNANSGPPPILSANEEKDIVNWIIENVRKGFPRRDSDVFFVVKEFLDASPRKNPFTGTSSVVCYTKLSEMTKFF